LLLRVFFAVVFLLVQSVAGVAQAPLTVFAAASMSEAMEQIGAAFQADTGVPVILSFAGTGTLARQIEAGAPADVIVSADVLWMEYLAERGAVRPESHKTIASNRLVLVGPKGAKALDLNPESLVLHLQDGRFAIADPETVPAGRYGKAALQTLGLWSVVEGRLAPMENVRVALAAAVRGDTPLALVYATDAAVEPGVTVLAEIPESSYPIIEYPVALTAVSSHPEAPRFLNYLSGPEAAKILRSFGFVTHKED